MMIGSILTTLHFRPTLLRLSLGLLVTALSLGDASAQPAPARPPALPEGTLTSGSISASILPCQESSPSCTAERVVIKLKGKPSPAFLTLTDPTRLVVDLPKNHVAGSKKLLRSETSANSRVKGIRLGMFGKRARIVIDLFGDSVPHYSVKAATDYLELTLPVIGSELKTDPSPVRATPSATPHEIAPTATATAAVTAPVELTLSTQATLPTQATVTSSPSRTSTATPTLSATPTQYASPTVAAQPTPVATPTIQPTSTATVTPVPIPSNSGIQGMRFTNDAGSLSGEGAGENLPAKENVFVVTLSFRPEYRFGKTGERRYKLTVPKVGKIPAGFLLPFFPAADVEGFEMAQASLVGDAAEITITVEQGVFVNAVTVGNSIVLRALPKK